MTEKPSEFREGGIYATAEKAGGFGLIKILKIDERGFHLRIYSNSFAEFPQNIDESILYIVTLNRKPGEELGIGHAPISRKSFSTWGAVFVQQSTVQESELAGYRVWQGAGGYF